jgi:integrase/recombinase XerD
MAEKGSIYSERQGSGRAKGSNVKPSRNYERFGETIRYLTLEELQKLFDCIEDYRHKLMLELIYHLGCRVGEFVRVQLKHLDFGRSSVLFPAENTKTRSRRTSWVPRGLMNEVASMLKSQGRMGKRDGQVRHPESFLFHPPGKPCQRYSENRLRQVFLRYVKKAGLDREYGQDSRGRKLHQFTIHSLRHSHIMHHVHEYKVPLPIVQKQVGHKTLKATSVYLRPSDEDVAEAYEAVGASSVRGRLGAAHREVGLSGHPRGPQHFTGP